VLPTIPVQPHSLDDYAAHAGEAAVERLREAARPLKGARFLHLNSTAFGGGVAELLYTQVPLMHDLGIEATWAVLEGSDDFFAVTKDVHNGLQGADIAWTPEKESIYWERIRANASELDAEFDVVFVHDPQPAGLIRVLEEAGARRGAWAWRCHIDMSAPNAAVWAFFEPLVNRYDAAVFTMEDFAQPGIRNPRVAFIPPSIDPTSSKNHELHEETIREILVTYGIDTDRPIVSQVSRFDPWKDPLGVIAAYRLARQELPDLQLGLVGSMALDDPQAWEIYREMQSASRGDHLIHIFTNLIGVGNVEVNAFQRLSGVVVQKSIREGFGLVVSEALWKGTPVVGGRTGGIPLQMADGSGGILVDSVEECAEGIVRLLRDPEAAHAMAEAGRERVRERFLLPRLLLEELSLVAALLSDRPVPARDPEADRYLAARQGSEASGPSE
jgi:trehalose synthase